MRYHERPQQVADQMVAEGLLQPHEPGLMCPPVYFLDKATQQQVGRGRMGLCVVGCVPHSVLDWV